MIFVEESHSYFLAKKPKLKTTNTESPALKKISALFPVVKKSPDTVKPTSGFKANKKTNKRVPNPKIVINKDHKLISSSSDRYKELGFDDPVFKEKLDEFNVPFTSVTSFLKEFEEYKDWDAIKSRYAMKNNMTIAQVTKKWDKEKNKGTARGTKHHNKREEEIHEKYANHLCDRASFNVYKHKTTEEGYKLDDTLAFQNDTLYSEKIMWIEGLRLCGTFDLGFVKSNLVYLDDYKTNKKLSFASFSGEVYNNPEYLLPPIDHIENCDIGKYALQLSLYMFMILYHNPGLKPGEIRILHERFNLKGKYTHTDIYYLNYLEEDVIKMLMARKQQLLESFL